jgi:hypothetical protein
MDKIAKVQLYNSFDSQIGEIPGSMDKYIFNVEFSIYNTSKTIYAKAIGTDGNVVKSQDISISVIFATPMPTFINTPTPMPVVTPDKVPSIRIVSPKDRTAYVSSYSAFYYSVPVSVEVLNMTSIAKVELYDSNRKIGEILNATKNCFFNVEFTYGTVKTIYAKAIGTDGTEVKSSEIGIAVVFPTCMPTSKPYIAGFVYPETGKNTSAKDFNVELKGIGYSPIKTNSSGQFRLNGISTDIALPIHLIIAKPGYLTRDISVSSLSVTYKTIPMWAGDINNDGSINLADIMIMANSFNAIEGEGDRFNEVCDFDMNKVVNMTDIMIAVNHFNATAASYDSVS